MPTVRLREEWNPGGWGGRFLDAFIDSDGSLVIEGQDLGPGTETVSTDGEYEWSYVYKPTVFPDIASALDGKKGEPILRTLRRWRGRADELERRLRAANIKHELSTWSG